MMCIVLYFRGHSQGNTVEEALENIKDAIKTYLEEASSGMLA